MTTQKDGTDSEFEKLKLLYESNSDQFKYFLTWRHLMLAGYFAIIAALALGFKWSLQDHAEVLFAFPLAGVWVSLLFWALDRRNRELYRLASKVGAELEKMMSPGAKGHFGEYSESKTKMGHGAVLAAFYLGSGFMMFVILVVVLRRSSM